MVNLERTNIADLHAGVIPEQLDLITMDLSYLSISDAIGQLSGLDISPRTALVALIKPTFELRRDRLVTRPDDIRTAIRHATAGAERHGWRTLAITLPTTTGAHGAIEAFLHAQVTDHPHRSAAP